MDDLIFIQNSKKIPEDTSEETTQKVVETAESSHEQKSKRSRVAAVISGFLFYATLIVLVGTAFLYGTNQRGVPNFFGYSYFTVLTESMESELPVGALIITKSVASTEIDVGDDITYLVSSGSTITHRVVDIYENYDDSGDRGFKTQGVKNAEADDDIVYAANVVGVVIFSAANLGLILTYIANNLWLVFMIFGILLILSFSLKVFFGTKK